MTSTPALRHLLGAYLNQDWFDFYPDENAAIDDFIRETPDLVDSLPREVDDLLASRDDLELESYLDSIGNEYLPSDDLGYRGWLTQIADRVRSAAAASGS